MENENLNRVSKVKIFTYVFNHEFNTVLETLKDMKKTNEMVLPCKVGYSKVKFRKLTNTWLVGAEFFFDFKNLVKVSFRTVKFKYNKEKAIIKFHIVKLKTELYMSYELFNDSINKTTTFVLKFDIVQNDIESVLNYSSNKERHLAFKTIDENITNAKQAKVLLEKIFIKTEFDLVCEIIIDLRKFIQIVKIFWDKVEYEGEMVEGCRIKFSKLIDNKKIVSFLYIKNISIGSNFMEISYECKSDPPIPHHTITFKVEKHKDRSIELKFINEYKEPIDNDKIKFEKKIKSTILKSLKKVLENH